MSKNNYQTDLAKVFAGTLLRASLTVLLLAPLAALSATKFSFDDPAGPQFSDADKQAQFEKGNGIVGLVRTAFDSGAESITIPSGDYRFGKETWGKDVPIYALEFRGMKRDAAHPFRIIAEGVTFWFSHHKGLFSGTRRRRGTLMEGLLLRPASRHLPVARRRRFSLRLH